MKSWVLISMNIVRKQLPTSKREKKELEDLRDEHPIEPRYRKELGRVYARLGDVKKAILEGNKAVELMPVSQYSSGGTWFEIALAEIYAWTGHQEQAIDKLEYLLSIPCWVHRVEIRRIRIKQHNFC